MKKKLAQLMTSTVKGQHQIRGVTTGQNIPTSASIQLLGIQKSRNLPGQVQFATRGLVTPQRNLAASVKIATPISAGNTNSSRQKFPIFLLNQNICLANSQLQPNAIQLTAGTTPQQQMQQQTVSLNNVMSPTQVAAAAAANNNNNNKNNRRRSLADANNASNK